MRECDVVGIKKDKESSKGARSVAVSAASMIPLERFIGGFDSMNAQRLTAEADIL